MGGSFLGLATPVAVIAGKPDLYPLAGVGLMLGGAVLVGLLGVLFYKFHSHNRYAGYVKLVAQEEFHQGKSPQGIVVLWESCVDALREIENATDPSVRTSWMEYAGGISVIGQANLGVRWSEALVPVRITTNRSIRSIARLTWAILPASFWAAVRLIRFVFWVHPPGSWRFPARVFRVVSLLSAAYLTIGMWLTLTGCGRPDCDTSVKTFAQSMTPLLTGVILFSLGVYALWLERLLHGRDTVDQFCWKFLPLRAWALERLTGGKARYWTIPQVPPPSSYPPPLSAGSLGPRVTPSTTLTGSSSPSTSPSGSQSLGATPPLPPARPPTDTARSTPSEAGAGISPD